jgi:hypothetical protein
MFMPSWKMDAASVSGLVWLLSSSLKTSGFSLRGRD